MAEILEVGPDPSCPVVSSYNEKSAQKQLQMKLSRDPGPEVANCTFKSHLSLCFIRVTAISWDVKSLRLTKSKSNRLLAVH